MHYETNFCFYIWQHYNIQKYRTLKIPALLTILVCMNSICLGQTDKMPVFKSTFSKKGQLKVTQRTEIRENHVQYLGPNKDTILLGRLNDLRTAIGENKVSIEEDVRQYSHYEHGRLKIVVDPSKRVTMEEYEWWTKERGYKYYKAYPILISSKTDSTTIVGYGQNIPIILEALDKDGWWKPIETEYRYGCGVGLEYILLKPREVLCVLAPIYTGEFKTKLRYRLGDSISAAFVGHISRSQFEFKGSYSN